MKCIDCKWYAGQVSDVYGVCKRYPRIENKTQHDWCGEFVNKFVNKEEVPVKLEFVQEYDIATDTIKSKPGRKPKNAS
jgi:hypothetical protein